MKSAYELAMERLNKSAPMEKLTDAQKKEIAKLNEEHQSKLAEREIFLKDKLGDAMAQGDMEAVQQIEKQMTSERKTMEAELEEKKEAVRKRSS